MDMDIVRASQLAPDHPLLQQAQAALTFQLEERKLYLQEQLRERSQGVKVRRLLDAGDCTLPSAVLKEHESNLHVLQDAKQERENLGVEMYGFQQHLTRVQKELQKAKQSTVELSLTRHSTEEHVSCLHKQADEESSLLQNERDKVHTQCYTIHCVGEAFRVLNAVPTSPTSGKHASRCCRWKPFGMSSIQPLTT